MQAYRHVNYTRRGQVNRDSKPATTLQGGGEWVADMGGHGRQSDKGAVGSATLQLLAL